MTTIQRLRDVTDFVYEGFARKNRVVRSGEKGTSGGEQMLLLYVWKCGSEVCRSPASDRCDMGTCRCCIRLDG